MRMKAQRELPDEDYKAMSDATATVRAAKDSAARLKQQVATEKQKAEQLRARLEGARSKIAALRVSAEALYCNRRGASITCQLQLVHLAPPSGHGNTTQQRQQPRAPEGTPRHRAQPTRSPGPTLLCSPFGISPNC